MKEKKSAKFISFMMGGRFDMCNNGINGISLSYFANQIRTDGRPPSNQTYFLLLTFSFSSLENCYLTESTTLLITITRNNTLTDKFMSGEKLETQLRHFLFWFS